MSWPAGWRAPGSTLEMTRGSRTWPPRWARRCWRCSVPPIRQSGDRAAATCASRSGSNMEERCVLLRCLLVLLLTCAVIWADDRVLVDREGSTGFVQLQAESFQKLSPRQQALTYWLAQASIAIDPINYDQNSAFGLRQKRLLEEIMRHPGLPDSSPGAQRKISDFTKLF